jgi:hypothetical protein
VVKGVAAGAGLAPRLVTFHLSPFTPPQQQVMPGLPGTSCCCLHCGRLGADLRRRHGSRLSWNVSACARPARNA